MWANWSKVKEGTASFNLLTQRAAGENLGKQSRHNSKALSKGMPEIPKRIFVTATNQSTTSSLSLFPLNIGNFRVDRRCIENARARGSELAAHTNHFLADRVIYGARRSLPEARSLRTRKAERMESPTGCENYATEL